MPALPLSKNVSWEYHLESIFSLFNMHSLKHSYSVKFDPHQLGFSQVSQKPEAIIAIIFCHYYTEKNQVKKSHRVTQKSSNVLLSYLSIPICLDASVWLSKCAKVNAYISLQLNNPSFYTETHSHRTQIKTWRLLVD